MVLLAACQVGGATTMLPTSESASPAVTNALTTSTPLPVLTDTPMKTAGPTRTPFPLTRTAAVELTKWAQTATFTPLPPTATLNPTEAVAATEKAGPVERLVFAGYHDYQSVITFINSDGSESEYHAFPNLFEFPGDLSEPSLSPDGRYLAFGSIANFEGPDGGGYFSGLFVADLRTNNVITVTGDYWWGSAASWSPDGRRLVFSSGGVLSIWNLDTRETQRIYPFGNRFDLYPAWSSSGDYIAFAHFESATGLGLEHGENHGQLSIVRPDGTELRVLNDRIFLQGWDPFSDFEGRYNILGWSPDSRWIAYLTGDTTPDIAIVNIETGEIRVLAPNPAKDVNPDWSPDGARLAFASNRNGKDEIFVVRMDGENLVNLTPNARSDNYSPIWSPRGYYIAFISASIPDTSFGELLVMNADGTGQKVFGYTEWRPVWMPASVQVP